MTSSENKIKAFERAGEPKKLVVFEGGHFDPFKGFAFFEASTAVVVWFKQYLKP